MLAKMRRLLVPMACVGSLFWIARGMTGQVEQPLWSIFVLPYAHFWYLQATFLIMVAFILLAWLTGGRGYLAAAVLACVGVAGWLLMPRPAVDVFSMAGAMRLSPFFAAGYLSARGRVWSRSREREVQQRRTGAVMLGLLLCCAMALATGAVILPAPWRSFAALGIGLGSCHALLMLRPSSTRMAWLGRRSYAIYLFHVFFTAGLHDMLLMVVPGLDPAILWPFGVVVGLAGPALLQDAILRRHTLSVLLLGLPLRRHQGRAVPSGIGQTG